MQIQKYPNTPNFTALHIADAGELKLYKLITPSDKGFIKHIPQTIKMEELLPNLSKESAQKWHEMIKYAIIRAQEPDNVTFLETFENRPCGIITYEPGENFFLDCICTWPIETGKKVYLAGKTLFYQLFKDFLAQKGSKIKLEAITDGPVDTIKKYSDLGFQLTPNVFKTKTIMETDNPSVKNILKYLESLINYKEIEPRKVDLRIELD